MLGVLPNAKLQRKGFRILVEYRLKANIIRSFFVISYTKIMGSHVQTTVSV